MGGVCGDDASLIGVEVGGYVVETELGRGGMGVVYAATHPMIGKRAAIKVMTRELSDNPAIVDRFIQEARSVNEIGHPNIVDIFAFGAMPDGRRYLVMDLVKGEPLRRRIKRGALPVPDAVALLDETACALIAAHDKGIIHRDLKPDNVFIVDNPARFEIRLLDFGLAKLLPTAAIGRAFRTATGAQIGTPDYMSPEQLRGSRVDHRTDIYALGIMMFETLTRSRPHRFPDGSFDLEGLRGATFKDALVAVPGVPVEVAALIDAMVSRDREERPTLAAIRAVIKRVRPSLSAMSDSLSNVRAVESTTSLAAFTPSNLGARPFVPSSPETIPSRPTPPTLVHEPPQRDTPATLTYEPPPASVVPDRMAVQSEQPPALSKAPFPASGLSAQPSHGGTKFGVPPPPTPSNRPHPVTAARRRRESPLLLVLILLLVVGGTMALVIVLMT